MEDRMGQVGTPPPVLLIMAVISREAAVRDWARDWGVSQFGPLCFESEPFDFIETEYYRTTMGEDLKKVFMAFERLVAPDVLPQIKVLTNAAESVCAAQFVSDVPRPLNLDPGLISESKLVLASTKDHAHRIYLGMGIFGELTLRFSHRTWQPFDWTYPDYRREDFHRFFSTCREHLRRANRAHAGSA
jgi:hypothetical protein